MYGIHHMLQRTQIYLDRHLHRDLKVGATSMNITISEYIRRILSEKVYSKKFTGGKITVKAPLSSMAKRSVRLGKKDLAKNFDAYLEQSLV